jgi:heme/copper-type cytochrome/quinol oxidase subunit 2
MGIGVSVFLIAVGAVLTFALEASAEGINLNTVGVILMVVGIIGLVLSMMVFGSWRERRDGDRVIVRDREVV